jgi:hypothetical protein
MPIDHPERQKYCCFLSNLFRAAHVYPLFAREMIQANGEKMAVLTANSGIQWTSAAAQASRSAFELPAYPLRC